MRGAAYMALTKDNVEYPHDYLETKGGKFPALSFFPCLVEPYLNEVRKDERLARIVREFLGDDVKQLNNQIYYRLPGDGDEFAWHQDVSFRIPREDYPSIETAYLQTLVVIDEITMENSPVEFIPGSHKEGEQNLLDRIGVNWMLRTFERKGLHGKKYLAKPGDVMIWSVLTVHGSEKNTSTLPRMTYMNGYARADAAKDWPLYLKDGKVVEIDPTKIP